MNRDQIERVLWTAVAAIVGMLSAPTVAGWLADLTHSSPETLLPVVAVVLTTAATLIKTYIAKRWGADTPAAWPNQDAG